MSTFVLVIISFALAAVVLLGAVNFPLMPAFFGVYDEARKQFRGRLIVKLLWAFPVVVVACLIIAWRDNGARLVALAPFFYLLALWLIRTHKQDTSATGKRFSHISENIAEQAREIEYKWASWEKYSGSGGRLSIEIWSPNAAGVQALEKAISDREQLTSQVVTEQDGNAAMVQFSISIDAFDKSSITSEINRMVDIAWQFNGELYSAEVEPQQ